MHSQTFIDKIDANALIQCKIVFFRPPTPDNGYEYQYEASMLFTDENKLWRFINRITNWRKEYFIHETLVPAKYIKTGNPKFFKKS